MLANQAPTAARSGYLARDVHMSRASQFELLKFIRCELPRWRDRPERKPESSETALTSQLCAHLNSAAHLSGWDFLQFRIEEPDEERKGRKIDLVPAPCAAVVWIEGRGYTDFDSLLPIECKRLPTPDGDRSRDEREYVFTALGTTGGVQRFKAGHHGAAHSLAAIIGYVQREGCAHWIAQITTWIESLTKNAAVGWTPNDIPVALGEPDIDGVAELQSVHSRPGLADIELRHILVDMCIDAP